MSMSTAIGPDVFGWATYKQTKVNTVNDTANNTEAIMLAFDDSKMLRKDFKSDNIVTLLNDDTDFNLDLGGV